MLRAAAKNFRSVGVVCNPERYGFVLDELASRGGLSLTTRRELAGEAFAQCAGYDVAIANWFSEDQIFPERLFSEFVRRIELPYGEIPHQRAAYYVERGARRHVLSMVHQHGGPDVTFNNIADLSAARDVTGEFTLPACVIVKHKNPCGVALAANVADAYEKALACDPMSAFGGVIAFNEAVDAETAEALHRNFVEVLIAPGYKPGALDVLQQKEAIRILTQEERRDPDPRERDVKRVRGGLLVQDRDGDPEPREIMEVATKTEPDERQWRDMLFAWTVVRHVRSNAIVIAKDGATLGIGAGQMSRVDSVRLAVEKCRDARGEEAARLLESSAVASDAFFPFADGPELALEAGATAVIQPGGSKRDAEVIAACDDAGVAMVFTKHRHFRH